MSASYFLSKSKYLDGLKCPKLLWMNYHAKDQFPPIDPATQERFDQGRQVTQLAHALFPDGLEITGEKEFDKIVQETQSMLALKKPLFEAGFRYKNAYARADILSPNKGGSWDIFEVKSATKMKDEYLEDIAFQKYCYEGAGLKIGRTYVVYINNEYIRKGELDAKALLVREEATEAVRRLVVNIEKRMDEMLEILEEKTCPQTKIGLQCGEPYECPLKELCWKFLPEQDVFVLNRIRREKAFAFINGGILDVRHIPPAALQSVSHQIVSKSHREGKVHINCDEVKVFLEQLKFPLYFLDFETVGSAIPFYDMSSPYQQVPFQFSLHVLSGWSKEPVHYAFLAEGKSDPRPEFLARLKSHLGEKGSILAFNLSFEQGKLEECVEVYPEHQEWLDSIEGRFLDLMDQFRKFHYYDPKQLGKYSIKSVYPALTDGSYENLGIADGGSASREFARVTFGEDISAEDRAKVRNDLKIYCGLDTRAMIDILQVLRKCSQ